jgi:hypothetical protein
MCDVLLPPGVNQIAIKYIHISYHTNSHLESFEMWCWKRMEMFSCDDQVRNEEVLLRVNELRNILHEISKRKANWVGHF